MSQSRSCGSLGSRDGRVGTTEEGPYEAVCGAGCRLEDRLTVSTRCGRPPSRR